MGDMTPSSKFVKEWIFSCKFITTVSVVLSIPILIIRLLLTVGSNTTSSPACEYTVANLNTQTDTPTLTLLEIEE
jgi:hypothetical protein